MATDRQRMAEVCRAAYWGPNRVGPWSEIDNVDHEIWLRVADAALSAGRRDRDREEIAEQVCAHWFDTLFSERDRIYPENWAAGLRVADYVRTKLLGLGPAPAPEAPIKLPVRVEPQSCEEGWSLIDANGERWAITYVKGELGRRSLQQIATALNAGVGGVGRDEAGGGEGTADRAAYWRRRGHECVVHGTDCLGMQPCCEPR